MRRYTAAYETHTNTHTHKHLCKPSNFKPPVIQTQIPALYSATSAVMCAVLTVIYSFRQPAVRNHDAQNLVFLSCKKEASDIFFFESEPIEQCARRTGSHAIRASSKRSHQK